MIKVKAIKSCCRSKNYILEVDKPVQKSFLQVFTKQGYIAPVNFVKSGIFYIRGNGITATCSFGSKKINVTCSGSNCTSILDSFKNILESALA